MTSSSPRNRRGFTLLEAAVGTLVAVLLLLGLLAVCDSAAHLNKSEIAAVEAQGSLRYGLNRIGGVVRMAGTGGLYVAQAVLVRPDPSLPGISASGDGDYDNVEGATVTALSGASLPVRPGTDVLEVRGVMFSPLFGFDETSGCGACGGLAQLTVRPVTSRGHVNDDPGRRPRFSEVDSYTDGFSAANPGFVIAAAGDDVHAGCFSPGAGRTIPPQPSYVVGRLASGTSLARDGTFGWVDFGDALAAEFATEIPDALAPVARSPLSPPLSRAGVLDDVLFFIDDSDPDHPALAQGVRRGARFDVVPLADDVENLQVAYGVDGLYGLDGRSPDGSLARFEPPSATDPDPDVSIRPDGDEWAPNAQGERLFDPAEFQLVQPPPAGFPHDGSSAGAHCPVLKAVMVSIVVRSHDPDPSYRGPDALAVHTMNERRGSAGVSSPPAARYRRRGQTVKIRLRNFGLDG